MSHPVLRQSTQKAEGAYQASKWLDVRVLLETEELRQFLTSLGSTALFRLGCLLEQGKEWVPPEAFIGEYDSYLQALKGHASLETLQAYRPKFTLALTADCDALYALPVRDNHLMVKIAQPVVQIQLHLMHFSTFDGEFRSMVNAPDAISWGLQFSYPQFVQDPHTKNISRADSAAFPNGKLFKTIQQLMREISSPTPFLIDGKRVAIPMRLGKKCFNWISEYSLLNKLNLTVLPLKVEKL